MKPWIVKGTENRPVRIIDDKVYYKYYSTAKYPGGIDFIRSHVIDYGKDLVEIERYIQADIDWYNENHKAIDRKYGGWIAINNKRVICNTTTPEELDCVLEDILPRTSYLTVLCGYTTNDNITAMYVVPPGLNLNFGEK